MHKIMVVDDEVIISAQLERRLSLMGYSVVGRANSGERSVSMARNLRPDLVLMDIVMPGRIDGIEAAGRILDETGIPVIFVTAYADDQYLARAKQVQPYGYILKPFHEKEVRAAIEIALSRRERERGVVRAIKQLETVVNMFDNAVVSLDDAGAIVFWNRKAQLLYGYSPSEVLGQRFSDFVVPDDRRNLERVIGPGSRAGNSQRAVERRVPGCRLITKDGAERPSDLLLFVHRVENERFTICLICEHGSTPVVSGAPSEEEIVPICSYCCKVRDDEGSWLPMPDYLGERCGLRFSHGICPSCLETYYPDVPEG